MSSKKELSAQNIHKSWLLIVAISTWILAFLTTIILPLPLFAFVFPDIPEEGLALILVSFSIGSCILYSSMNKKFTFWKNIAVFLGILALSSLIAYFYAISFYTLPYQEFLVIKGDELLPQMESIWPSLLDVHGYSNVMMSVGGDSTLVWTSNSIRNTSLVVLLIWSSVYLICSAFIVSLSIAITLKPIA